MSLADDTFVDGVFAYLSVREVLVVRQVSSVLGRALHVLTDKIGVQANVQAYTSSHCMVSLSAKLPPSSRTSSSEFSL